MWYRNIGTAVSTKKKSLNPIMRLKSEVKLNQESENQTCDTRTAELLIPWSAAAACKVFVSNRQQVLVSII